MSSRPASSDTSGGREIRTLFDIVRCHAAERPDRPAIVFEGRVTTFSELLASAERMAQAMTRSGIGPGDRIGLLDKNRDTFFPLLFGAARIGAVLVPLNFRLMGPEIEYILSDSGARLLLAAGEFGPVLEGLQASGSGDLTIIWTDGPVENPNSLVGWSAGEGAALPSVPTPADVAVQMYTSGTTGYPKGVELSHAAMICAAREGLSVWPAMFRHDAAVLATMPLFHIAACNLALAGLFVGARAEIMRTAGAAEIIHLISEHAITIAPLPAALIHDIVRLKQIRDIDLSCLDTLLIAGSGISVELLREAQQVLGCGFALSYGMTECCGGLTYLGPEDCTHDAGEKLRSAGRPFGSSRLKIVDPSGSELPAGVVGEILCQSDRVMNGYWKRAEETRMALKDGWYHSGDAGFLDGEGYLYVVDRIRDMVISGGENIYPAQIEAVLTTCPGVSDAAVIGVPDPKWGESLVACIIASPESQPEPSAIEAFLKERLASYKVPRRYVFLQEFPRNASGKVLKRRLREVYSVQG